MDISKLRIGDPMLLEEKSESLVLLCNGSSCGLDLRGCFCACAFADSKFGFKFLEVFLSASSGTALIVTNASQIWSLVV